MWVIPVGRKSPPDPKHRRRFLPLLIARWRFDRLLCVRRVEANQSRRRPTLQTLCQVQVGRGGSWNRAGDIVFCPDFVSPIFKVSAKGGKPVAVTRLEEQHQVTSHRWLVPARRPSLPLLRRRPGGRSNRFHGIYAASLDWEPQRRVLSANSNTAYADGHLLFLRHGALMAQPFDLKRYALGGNAFQLAEQVRYEVPQMSAMFSASGERPAGVSGRAAGYSLEVV